MKLGDFLNTIAAKSGKQDEIKDVLNNPALATIEIPDETANAINSGLLTFESAKNNTLLKNHFSASALNGVDTELLATIDALGLGDDVKTELTNEKNTYQKQRILTNKIKTAFDNLKNAKQEGDPKDIEKYTTQINGLQSQLAALKDSHIPKSELETLKKLHETEVKDFLVSNFLATKKFANEGVSQDVNVLVAKTLLNQHLESKGALLVKDGAKLKLMQLKEPTLDYYDEQQKAVSFSDFADGVLSANKLLQVSDPNKGKNSFVQPKATGVDTSHVNAAAAHAINNLAD